jgi:hypothetical protein
LLEHGEGHDGPRHTRKHTRADYPGVRRFTTTFDDPKVLQQCIVNDVLASLPELLVERAQVDPVGDEWLAEGGDAEGEAAQVAQVEAVVAGGNANDGLNG